MNAAVEVGFEKRKLDERKRKMMLWFRGCGKMRQMVCSGRGKRFLFREEREVCRRRGGRRFLSRWIWRRRSWLKLRLGGHGSPVDDLKCDRSGWEEGGAARRRRNEEESKKGSASILSRRRAGRQDERMKGRRGREEEMMVVGGQLARLSLERLPSLSFSPFFWGQS